MCWGSSGERCDSNQGALRVGKLRQQVEQLLAGGHLDPLDAREPAERLLERVRIEQFLPCGEGIGIGLPRRVGGTRQVALDVREPRFAVAGEVPEPVLGQSTRLCDEFRAAPIPTEWKKDAELRGTYYDALDAASEPFKTGNAKPALKKCLDLSVQYQYFDSYSRDCEVWLAKNYKAEYHVVDELRGAPTQSNNGADDPVPPLTANGQLYEVGVPVAAPAPAPAPAAAGTN